MPVANLWIPWHGPKHLLFLEPTRPGCKSLIYCLACRDNYSYCASAPSKEQTHNQAWAFSSAHQSRYQSTWTLHIQAGMHPKQIPIVDVGLFRSMNPLQVHIWKSCSAIKHCSWIGLSIRFYFPKRKRLPDSLANHGLPVRQWRSSEVKEHIFGMLNPAKKKLV